MGSGRKDFCSEIYLFLERKFSLQQHLCDTDTRQLPADSAAFTSICSAPENIWFLWLFLEHLLRAGASSVALNHTRVLCYQFALLWGIKGIWNTLVCIKGDWPAGFSKVWESEQSSSLRDCLVLMESKADLGKTGGTIHQRRKIPLGQQPWGTINRCFTLLSQSECLILSPSSQGSIPVPGDA